MLKMRKWRIEEKRLDSYGVYHCPRFKHPGDGW
jgi:hypothetical protein